MRQPEGLAWPVKVGTEVYLNQYKMNDDIINYWIDINGETVALTRAQYICLYEARLELWDDVVRRTEERIIKLLEEHRAWLVQHNHEGDNFIKAFAFQDAIALIKGGK